LASSAERAYHVSEAGDGGRQLPLACQYNSAGDRIVLVDEAGCAGIFDTSRTA
ncbi:hypothetical protein FB639_005383, partial [Coemansia asiatica]